MWKPCLHTLVLISSLWLSTDSFVLVLFVCFCGVCFIINKSCVSHLNDSVNDGIAALRQTWNVGKFYMLPLVCVLILKNILRSSVMAKHWVLCWVKYGWEESCFVHWNHALFDRHMLLNLFFPLLLYAWMTLELGKSIIMSIFSILNFCAKVKE